MATLPNNGLGQHTLNSIREKALSGQSMQSPTAEKTALYDYYKANPNAQVTGPLGGSTLGSIQQKSQLGQSMMAPTGEKQALYNHYQNTGVNPSVKKTDVTAFDNNKNTYNQSVNNANQDYENSQARQDATKWNNATISDIAAKYGFDYSRDYAKTQAEAEAQALRNANADAKRRNESNKKTGTANIDNNLMNQSEALDRNYFQQYLGQAQNQTNSGLNGGIASDQDLRLQMNRQAEMGASYRDANLGKMKIDENYGLEDMRLTEGMGLINQQALARTDSLYNERLQQGFGNLMSEREMVNSLDQQQWGRSQADMDRAMQLLGMDNSQQQFLQNFDYQKGRDLVGDNRDARDFSYGQERDQVQDSQWNQSFDWSKMMDEAGLTGNFNGGRTLAGSQFDWGKSQDLIANQQWQKEFDEDVRQFGMNYALQKLSINSRGGGPGGGSPVGGNPSNPSPPAQSLAKQFNDFKTSANNQVDTFADSYYKPRIDAINKLVSPTNQAAYKKAITGIKAPTYYDRALDLFK